jgi:hypothetical protein
MVIHGKIKDCHITSSCANANIVLPLKNVLVAELFESPVPAPIMGF